MMDGKPNRIDDDETGRSMDNHSNNNVDNNGPTNDPIEGEKVNVAPTHWARKNRNAILLVVLAITIILVVVVVVVVVKGNQGTTNNLLNIPRNIFAFFLERITFHNTTYYC
jgi:hypothetical protein